MKTSFIFQRLSQLLKNFLNNEEHNILAVTVVTGLTEDKENGCPFKL